MPDSQLDMEMRDAARDVANRTERMLNLWMRHAAAADKWHAALTAIVESGSLAEAKNLARAAL